MKTELPAASADPSRSPSARLVIYGDSGGCPSRELPGLPFTRVLRTISVVFTEETGCLSKSIWA